MLQQLRATTWALQLDEASASLLSELCIGAGQWADAAQIFEQRKTASQAVSSEMWNAAMLAQSRTDNQQGLHTTWQWAREAHSEWKIHDPHCYLQVAQGVAAIGGPPVQGADLMLAYHEQKYSMPLSVEACNAFLRCCTEASSSTANNAEAAVRLMSGMQPPLPLPDMETFSAVTTCVLSKLCDGTPAYQLPHKKDHTAGRCGIT